MELLPDQSVQDSVVLAHVDPATFRRRTPELIDVYLTAMHYPADLAGARGMLWEEHSRRDGFSCVIATGADDRIRGLAYGYRGAPGQWWYSEVRRGVSAADQHRELADFFELTELHVHPNWQGHGLGEALLRELARDRPERRMLLSTPEGRTGRGGCTAGSASPTSCETTGSPATRGRSVCSGGTCRWPRPPAPSQPNPATP